MRYFISLLVIFLSVGLGYVLFNHNKPKAEAYAIDAQSFAVDAAALADIPPSSPVSLPARNIGLWSFLISEEKSDLAPQKIGVCLDQKIDTSLGLLAQDLSMSDCSQSLKKADNGDLDLTVRCDMGSGGLIVYSAMIKGDYSKDYEMKLEAKTSGAALAQMNRTVTYDIKAAHIGACEAGQNAGDLMIGATKLNLFALAGKS